MNRAFLLFYVLLGLVGACRSQTNEEKMQATSNKVLEALKSGDAKEFRDLLGRDLSKMSKNEYMFAFDFKKTKTAYDRYIAGKEAKIIITDEIDGLGIRKVIIPFYDGYDSVNKVSNVRLELYFGPPNFVPLNKLTNYKMVMEYKLEPGLIKPPVAN